MEIEDRILIITDSISVSAALVFWVFKNFSVQLQNLSIITQASLLGAEDSLCFNPGSVSSAISISLTPGFHTQLWLKELAKVLKPDGFLLVQEPSYLNHNKQLMLGDSRASLERNLLFAGFYSIEGLPCLNLNSEISFHSRQFELIAMKAKKSGLIESAVNFPNPKSLSTPENVCHDKEQEKADEPEDLPNDSSLVAPRRTRKKKSNPDKHVDMKERIRERNRLYQRRRRERMSEEEKNREKERRKLYMQKRRTHQLTGSENEPQLLD